MKVTRTVWVTLLVVLLVGFTTACQRSNDNSVQAAREDNAYPPKDNKVLSPEERDVAMKIEQAHLGEVDLARLAKEKAGNRDVRSYADMIVDDHSDALKDLQKLMGKNGVNESTHSKPAQAEETLSTLENLSGPSFDREYMNAMVTDHQKDLEELKSAQASVQNADLKDYINNLIPTVQKHLEKAQDLQSKLTATGN